MILHSSAVLPSHYIVYASMVSINSQPLPGANAMPPPSIPAKLSRRPTISSKRDSSFIDTDDEAGLSLSTKKLKVAFAPHVDVRIMEDWKDKSMELVRHEVQIAVGKHTARSKATAQEDEQYNSIVRLFKQNVFEPEAASSRLLAKYITQIETEAIKMDRCGRLVVAILDLPWLGRSEDFIAVYLKFLISLNSAYVKYLQPTLERMVAFYASLPASQGRLPSEDEVPRSVMFTRLHSSLKAILNSIPSASNMLLRAIRAEYPNEIATTKSYSQYQKHLFRLAENVPELKSEIMAIVVQRLVALDVQIQQDMEEIEDEAEERFLERHDPSAQGREMDESDNESVSSSELTRTEEEERAREIRLKINKMDATMDLLFAHYTSVMRNTGNIEDDAAFQELITIFETFILPNRTRHAQFIIFHFSQLSSDHMTGFAQQCIERGFGSSSVAQKCSAIAYLSSFTARGARVTRSTVLQCFEVLCDYLELMRKHHEKTCTGPDRRAYMEYYAVAQALLYIFCFRWRDLALRPGESEEAAEWSARTGEEIEYPAEDLDDTLADNGELRWYPRFKEILQRNIFSILNPLRVCAPTVVAEFAKISRHVRFIEVVSKIESNKRLRLGQTASYYGTPGGFDVGRRETAVDRRKGDAHLQLAPYFPFDPYQLSMSKRWLVDDYNDWKAPRDMKKDDDYDYDYDDEDGDCLTDEDDSGDEDERYDDESVAEPFDEESTSNGHESDS